MAKKFAVQHLKYLLLILILLPDNKLMDNNGSILITFLVISIKIFLFFTILLNLGNFV